MTHKGVIMKKMTRIVSALAALTMVASVAACGSSTGAKDTKTCLLYTSDAADE